MKKIIVASLLSMLIMGQAWATDASNLDQKYEQLWNIIKPNFSEPKDQEADLAKVKELYSPELVQLFEKKKGGLLTLAVRNEDGLVAEFLLEKGVNPNTKDALGQTGLMQAAAIADFPLVQKFIAKGADITLKDSKGRTAYDHAKIYLDEQESGLDDLEPTKSLKQIIDSLTKAGSAGSKTETKEDVAQQTKAEEELHKFLARGKDNAEEFQKVFANLKSDSNYVIKHLRGDFKGQSILDLAVSYSKPNVVLFLLKHGANPNVKNPSNGDTPLIHAARTGQATIVKALLEAKADKTTTNDDDETAYDAGQRGLRILPDSPEYIEISNLLKI